MNKYKLINFARRGFHFYKKVVKRCISIFKPVVETDRLLFTFSGRNDGWPVIGRQMYQKYPTFRVAIQECNRILVEMGGAEIISYFEAPVNVKYFQDESKFSCITAIQLATVIAYNELGIFPNAVMGVSIGEPSAAFAAGAITLKEALSIALSYVTIFKEQDMDYHIIFLKIEFDPARQLCQESPVWTEVIYQDSPHAVLVTCQKNDIDELKTFFSSKGLVYKLVSEQTFFPYHSSKIVAQRKMLNGFHRDIEPRPLKCDYYSPVTGSKIPKNSILPADYWYNLTWRPVLFSNALEHVLKDGYKIFLQIGPPAISERQILTVAQANQVTLLNSFQKQSDEIEHHGWVQKQLSEIKFEHATSADEQLMTLSDFLGQFNVHSVESDLPYQYLRKNGSIHFLLKHNGWIILNYDDIEYVLREPHIFSSSLLKDYDPILLGADPEKHKVIRTFLQPLFSTNVIDEMAQFTALTANAFLDSLCKKDNFDFVSDYADPLSLLVLCNFFGLSSDDAQKMLVYTGKDYHNMLYWQRLEEFFTEQFTTCGLSKDDCLWGKLRSLVKNNEFALADAISLLKIVWTAGMATTSALISTSIKIALNNPDLAKKVSTDEKLVSKFIEECLRLQTPISAIYRLTTEKVTLCGQELPANTMVMLHLKSGMTDPSHFTDPEEFSVNRPAKRHLAFGAGIHQCIGMGLARAEARSALKMVLAHLDQLKNYTVAEPEYFKASDLETMSSLKMNKRN